MVDQQTAVLMGKLAFLKAKRAGVSDAAAEVAANDAYLTARRVVIPAAVYEEWDRLEAARGMCAGSARDDQTVEDRPCI